MTKPVISRVASNLCELALGSFVAGGITLQLSAPLWVPMVFAAWGVLMLLTGCVLGRVARRTK